MGKIIFAEILDRRGNVRERVRIDSFPARVGRAYTNAVIIDDRLVGVEHLRLSLDPEGGILVEDLHTPGGTRWFKSRKRLDRYTIPPGGEAVVRIGQTVLRLRGDDFAVRPASSPRVSFGRFGRILESSAVAFLVFVAGFGINVLTYAQEIGKKVIWSDLIGMSLVLLIVFAAWTGFWSFLTRLLIHSFRFTTHLAISSVASVVFLLLFIGADYFEFIFSAPGAAAAARFAGFAVVFSMLLYAHLSVMSDHSSGKLLLSSALVSAGIVGIILLIGYTRGKEFSTELHFSSVLKPVSHPWVRTVSSDQFFGDLDKLRSRIDAMAREIPKGRAKEE